MATVAVAGIDQPMRVAALAYGPAERAAMGGQRERAVDFFDIKGDVEVNCSRRSRSALRGAPHPALHPGRSARVQVARRDIGWVGELHPRWCQGYELPHRGRRWSSSWI